MTRFLLFSIFLFNGILLCAQQLEHRWGEIIVSTDPAYRIEELLPKHFPAKNISSPLSVKRQISRPLNLWLLAFDPNKVNEYELLTQLRQRKGIRMAQFNHIVQSRQTTPNDPRFGELWHWRNTTSSQADVDADLAWDITTGGRTANGTEIVVAVLDDGAEIDHPDLAANHWVNKGEIPNNNFDDDGNGYIDDYNGWAVEDQNDQVGGGDHGTQVNGLIGAIGNNQLGITGLNWNVKIMTIKAENIIDEATVLESYAYPLEQRRLYNQTNGQSGAFVVVTNSSWGFDRGQPSDAPIWCAYYDTLGQAGILNCAATTNGNINVDVEGDLPTGCTSPFLIGVTSTNQNDEHRGGFGPLSVDLAAPGIDVLTTDLNAGYRLVRGTSFATPVVAGMVSLLYAAPCGELPALAQNDPAAAALLARQYILDGVDQLDNLEDIVGTSGRANAFNSLQQLIEDCGSCLYPFGQSAQNITANGAFIQWSEGDSTQSVSLRWREAGSSNWTELSNVTSPFELTNLRSCTQYEVQLQSQCTNGSSDYSPSLFFQTINCCERPTGLAATNIGPNQADIQWDSETFTSQFNIRYRLLDAMDWTTTSSSTNALSLPNLDTCAPYELQVQSDCDSTTSSYSASLVFRTKGCGSCLDLTYCEGGSENSAGEWIERFAINDIDNRSGNNQGYGDFTTSFSTQLQAGGSYPIAIVPGHASVAFTEYMRIWIDYNLDGDFEDVGELAYEAPPSSDSILTTLTIPAWAKDGTTRMRVSLRFGQYGTECEILRFGEVEDYCVDLIGGDGCPPPQVSLDRQAGDVQVVVAASTSDAEGMQGRLRPLGEVLWGSAFDLSEGANSLPGSLAECQVYELQVRSICGIAAAGNWGDSQFFKTLPCGACTQNTYCESGGTSSAFGFISRVQFNNLDHESGEDGGYGNFTDFPFTTVLGRGSAYELSIEPLFPLSAEEVRFAAWMDFNQNGSFDGLEETLFVSDVTNEAITRLVGIPTDAVLGSTRLRISMVETMDNVGPCDNFSFGETQDYCVTIVESDEFCSFPQLDSTSTSSQSIQLDWADISNAEDYLIRYRPEGSTNWTEAISEESNVQLSRLFPCTPYEVQAASICNGQLGSFSDTEFYATRCATSTNELEKQTFSSVVWPNPVQDYLLMDLDLSEAGVVQLELYDLTGKQIWALSKGEVASGRHRWELPMDLVAGLYYLRLQVGEVQKVHKLIAQ
ncbi:MAG: GEVED domain-containing protein [Bacteroidota bacterium]